MANLGASIAGTSDIDTSLSRTSGRRQLAQSVFRRLRAEAGSLAVIGGDPSYGYNLIDSIGAAVRASEVEQRVTEQCVAEERIVDADVSVNFDKTAETLRVEMELVDSEGPFQLVTTVSGRSVEECH